MNQKVDNIIENICGADNRYKIGAYEFVLAALSHTQKKCKRIRHVTGEELLSGIRELLEKEFGLMTLTVLEHWGIKTTEDFGNIVFHLVQKKILSKTEEDSIESFKNGYDFQKAFSKDYRRKLEKKISRMRSG